MKAAVYCGTRNVYEDMIPSMKSLLIHSDVNKIYFLIEDDEFPYPLPPEVECINIKNQTYFLPDGPNYVNTWCYIILLRAAYAKIFPNIDTILSLDIDTIINENISNIWDLPIENYYFAAAKEPIKTTENFLYTNIGVALFNLKKIREDKLDDKLIQALNTKKYNFPEQDCLNELCQNYILELPSDYNVCNYTDIKHISHRKINHYARVKNWKKLPLVQKYNKAQIIRNISETINLDIIIPAYNNEKGLITTLKSVYYPELQDQIQITVVDDCSTTDYSSIKEQYPNVNFIRLEKNSGPGIARQTGIINTTNSHILFVDCGDKLFSKFTLLEILDTLQNNTVPDLYLWTWVNGEWNTISGKTSFVTPGYVYKREFLELYHITYSNESSYSNEDFGFNYSCQAILTYIKSYDRTPHKLFFETPIYKMIYDKDSLTHKNNGEYMLTTHLKGLILNCKHIIKTCIYNNLPKPLIQQELNYFIIRIYFDFICNAIKKSPYLQDDWINIYNFYHLIYMKYNNSSPKVKEHLSLTFGHYVKQLLKITKGKITININAFLNELTNSNILPEKYKL